MKRLFWATIFAAMVGVSCQSGGDNSFTISGKFEGEDGMNTVRLIEGISSIDDVIDMQALDKSGVFSFSGQVDTPYMAQIIKNGDNMMSNSVRGIIFVESGDIKISVDDMGRLIATGGLNERFKTLIADFTTKNEEIQNMPPENMMAEFNAFVFDKIDENLDNPLGLFIISQVVMRDPQTSSARVLEILSKFSPEMQGGRDAMEIKEELEKRAAVDIGAPYMDLTLNDTKGDAVSISSLVGEGKWVLIDFWATWCSPCMAEMPYLQEAYAEYHKLGFEICGISLDRNDETWRGYCDENLAWINLLAGDSDATQIYKVQSVPTNFLISPDGKITYKNLRGSMLDVALKEIFKNN